MLNSATSLTGTAVLGKLAEATAVVTVGGGALTTLGSYALDIGVSAVTSYGSGLGSKHATNLGKQTVKRVKNAFAYDGVCAGFVEMDKATKWYWKSSRKLIKNLAFEQGKIALTGLAEVGASCLFT